MRPPSRRVPILITLIVVAFLTAGFLGCSQEAKLARHWKKAEKYISENKINEAIIEYKNVVQLNPKDAQAHYKLGLAYLRVRNPQAAFSEFSKSVNLDPNLNDARLQLGLSIPVGQRCNQGPGAGGESRI